MVYVATAAAVIIAVVVALVVVRTTGSNSTTNASRRTAPSDVVSAATSVPASALQKVGLGGSGITPPQKVSGVPALSVNGKPEVFFAGGEYCPYCAADRWSVVVALSRFGSFSGLKVVTSSSSDVYPSTNTFSFYGSKYQSPYLVFTPVELYDTAGKVLQPPTTAQRKTIATYDTPKYVTRTQQSGSIPFIDWGGQYLSAGAPYSPQVLQGLSWGTIAGSLSQPSSAPAQNIDAAANWYTATICELTHGQPGNVCNTPLIHQAQASLAKGK